MRGCLFVVVLATAVLGTVVWLAGPVLAATVVRASLDGAGVVSDDPAEVDVRVASPLDLLAGRAESVTIRMGVGRTDTIDWQAATVDLLEADLLGRRVGRIRVDVERPGLAGDGTAGLTADRLSAEGRPHDAAARIVVPVESFEQHLRLVVGRLEPIATDLRFVAPDRLVSADATFAGRLRVEDGGLVLDPELAVLPTIEIFRFDPSVPFELTGAGIEADRLVLLGRLDLSGWLG